MTDLRTIYEQSYVPYSAKPELAVVRSENDRFYAGSRVENVSYPLSITAAQNALFCCLSEGGQPAQLWVSRTDDHLLPFWKAEFNIGVQALNPDRPPSFELQPVNFRTDRQPDDLLPGLLGRARTGESNFPVAALLKTREGYVSGVNIECSSWSLGLCAERVALAKALTYGHLPVTELHIHSRDGEFSSPCGACRQVICEHMPNRRVYLYHADRSRSAHFSNDLLPFSFHSSKLSN